MNKTPMEDFFEQTRHNYSVVDCKMGELDCRNSFKVIGTIHGYCLAYNPCDQKFSRDSELKITLQQNTSGKRYCNLL